MNKKRKMMLMSMTDEEIWLSQFDERDFEASEILLHLQRQPMHKKRRLFLVVWGRKKRRSPRRVSGMSPKTPLPTVSDSGYPKRRKLLGEFAEKPNPEIKISGLKLVIKLRPKIEIINPPLTCSESDRPMKKRKLAEQKKNPWLMPPPKPAHKIYSTINKQGTLVAAY